MGKRSPEVLSRVSRPFSTTTCKGSPVAGLLSRATVCGRSAQGRRLPGLPRASTAKTNAPRRQPQATSVSKGIIRGAPVPLKRRNDQYPAQIAKIRTKKAGPSPSFERRGFLVPHPNDQGRKPGDEKQRDDGRIGCGDVQRQRDEELECDRSQWKWKRGKQSGKARADEAVEGQGQNAQHRGEQRHAEVVQRGIGPREREFAPAKDQAGNEREGQQQEEPRGAAFACRQTRRPGWVPSRFRCEKEKAENEEAGDGPGEKLRPAASAKRVLHVAFSFGCACFARWLLASGCRIPAAKFQGKFMLVGGVGWWMRP